MISYNHNILFRWDCPIHHIPSGQGNSVVQHSGQTHPQRERQQLPRYIFVGIDLTIAPFKSPLPNHRKRKDVQDWYTSFLSENFRTIYKIGKMYLSS